MKNKNNITVELVEWLIYIAGYSLVFIFVSTLFKSFYIDNFLVGILSVIVIYALNKTVKPVLVWLTLPITGLTLGLFYPMVNVLILKLADWILGSHFNLDSIIIAFFIAIMLSVMNIMMEDLVIKPVIRRLIKHE